MLSQAWARHSTLFIFPFFLLVCLMLYSPVLHAPFIFDDYVGIIDNSYIRDFMHTLLRERLFRKITYLTFAMNYAWSGLDTLGYHLTNITIHAIAAFFLFVLYRLLEQNPANKYSTKSTATWPFVAALLFLIHPLQVESVAYVYQRTTSLSGMFYALTLATYVWARHKSNRMVLLLSFIFLFLSFFTKRTTVTLPIALIALEFFFFNHKPVRERLMLGMMLIGMFCIIPFIMLQPHFHELSWDLILSQYPTPANLNLSYAEYFWTELNVLRTYLRMMLWPLGLSLVHDYPYFQSFWNWPTLFSCATLSGMLLASVFTFKRFRLISFFLLLTLLVWVPELLVIRDVMFEHRTYLALFGFLPLITLLIGRFIPSISRFIFVFLIGIAIVLTFQRNIIWSNPITLWENITEHAPMRGRSWTGLGVAHARQGNVEAAKKAYEKSIAVAPGYTDAHYNLGNLYQSDDALAEAKKAFQSTVRINPSHFMAWANLGVIAFKEGDMVQAKKYTAQALKYNSGYSIARLNMGILLEREGKLVEALTYLEDAYTLTWANESLQDALIRIHTQLGNKERLVEILAKKQANLSEHQLENRGLRLAKEGDYDNAIPLLKDALNVNPKNEAVLNNLALCYYRLKNYELALKTLRQLLEVNPAYPGGTGQYTMLLRQMGRQAEAEDWLEQHNHQTAKK